MPLSLRLSRRLAPALLVLLGAGAGFGGGAAAGEDAGPARCKIRVAHGSGLAVTAKAVASAAANGRYSFRVSGRGTDIRQDGDFRAGPRAPATSAPLRWMPAGGLTTWTCD